MGEHHRESFINDDKINMSGLKRWVILIKMIVLYAKYKQK